ncbi:EamA family transporter [Nocardioides sp. Kera G14]|uniref:EamA family transporter n=1 Tax=Nocardioides sp. Kera G14 TaxID=2884264 RepID=UPI001D0F9C5A|nr:EamA family transporter [Nocardioides sp. Kera G14]UDY25229.1 DMT family transporter [Nocardioides sp. Kera G14]
MTRLTWSAMDWNISYSETTIVSVESSKALALASLAPIAWGTGYYVTDAYLPPDRPLFGAAVRALPFGLLLLALRPAPLRGSWWWRTAVLGVLNFAAFFVLIFIAAYRLPGGVAATLTATSPIVVMLLAWLILGERPVRAAVIAAAVGIVGVGVLVLRGGISLDPTGVLASLAAVLCSSLGFVLVRSWRPPVPLLTFTAWQLVFGGLALMPVALLVEGAPPALDARAVVGFAYLGLVGTVIAYVVWFQGLRRAPAAAVSLVGLLNPVAGAVVGVTLAHDAVTWTQMLGMVLVLGGVVAGQSSARRAPAALAAPETGDGGLLLDLRVDQQAEQAMVDLVVPPDPEESHGGRVARRLDV